MGTIEELYRDLLAEPLMSGVPATRVKPLLKALLDEADMGFDERIDGAPECKRCTWDSGPYSLPCEQHSRLSTLSARIEALPDA